MNNDKLTIKYSIGLLIITIIVLVAERIIFSLLGVIDFGGLILCPIVIPMIGLYLLQKTLLKNNMTDVNVPDLLTKFLVISLVYMLISAIYIACRLHILIDVKDALLVLSQQPTIVSSTMMQVLGKENLEVILINNSRYVMYTIIISTIYISTLTFSVVRYWTNNSLNIEKSKRARFPKNFKVSVILLIIILIIEISIAFGLDVWKTHKMNYTEIKISVTIESGKSNKEREKIENKLNEIEEIIKYEYKSNDDALDEMKQVFKGYNVLTGIDSDVFPSTYEITLHKKDKEMVINKLKLIDGINVK